MKKTLYYILTLWGVLWCQVASNHFLGGTALSVHWVLVAVLYFGLSQGPIVGQGVGILWGLLIDSSSLGLVGTHSLLYAVAGYVAGMFRRQLDASKIWTQTLFSWIVSLVYWGVYGGLDRLFSAADRPISWIGIAQPFMNAALAPAIFWALARWSHLWSVEPREN